MSYTDTWKPLVCITDNYYTCIIVYSGAGVVYVVNEVEGTMEVSYNLEVQSKDYPGKLSIYSSRFYSSPILIGPLSTRPPLLSGHSTRPSLISGHPSYQARCQIH